jgi:hypothetical protein
VIAIDVGWPGLYHWCVQIREGEKQRAELTAQFDAERLRRRRLIEAKGDIELSIRELFGVKLESEVGVPVFGCGPCPVLPRTLVVCVVNREVRVATGNKN